MSFENTPMEWNNAGTPPSADLSSNGYKGGDHPAADTFNYFFNNNNKCITELQNEVERTQDNVETAQSDIATAQDNITELQKNINKKPGEMVTDEDTGNVGEIFNAYDGSNVASGDYSHAEGYSTLASGEFSHAEGAGTTAEGQYSHAENNATAYGDCSHAEGISNATNECSHAEGMQTESGGVASHAEGYNTRAGDYSHAGGYNTTACNYQFVTGKYNKQMDYLSSADDNSDNTSIFIIGNGTSDARANAFRISSAGACYGVSSFNASGADYAEYFEWLDGNEGNEDRRGLFVTLDGEKIRIATGNDDYILGVISSTPSAVGDTQSELWKGMYQKDIFGKNLTETVEVEETTDETGKTIPSHTETHYLLNEDYDAEQTYINRESRPEWSAVGMLGKLIVIDDGSCEVNGYCTVADNGIATASETGYRVLTREDETHIKILFR